MIRISRPCSNQRVSKAPPSIAITAFIGDLTSKITALRMARDSHALRELLGDISREENKAGRGIFAYAVCTLHMIRKIEIITFLIQCFDIFYGFSVTAFMSCFLGLAGLRPK
jgi:hypothetical protein